jgi:hypothetical protein
MVRFFRDSSIVGIAMGLVLTEVEPETAESLAAQAQAQGLSVDAYLRLLLGMPRQKNALTELSDEAFDTLMEEFASGTEDLPPLPADFSRQDMYLDHD